MHDSGEPAGKRECSNIVALTIVAGRTNAIKWKKRKKKIVNRQTLVERGTRYAEPEGRNPNEWRRTRRLRGD